MMKKQGFTLIELLVVLVVMGIVLVVVTQSYQNITANSNETKYKYYEDSMKTAAELLLEGHKKSMNDGDCISISYQKLVDSGKLKEEKITCTGFVQLKKNGNKFTYDMANLACKNENDLVLKEKTAEVSAVCTEK